LFRSKQTVPLKHSPGGNERPMKPVHIGIVVSSPSINASLKRLSEQRDIVIRISYQGLEQAIAVGRQMAQDGIEVLIGRRGTAHLLRENLNIPVLSLPQSSLNVLKSIREASKIGRRVFMPSFRDLRPIAEVVKEFMDVDFAQDIYTDSASLRQIIASAACAGYEVAVGGASTLRFAAEFGLKFTELMTSEEEVTETVENARSVALSQREQLAEARRYQSIIDATSDGIIATDPAGRVTTINRAAARMLEVNGNSLAGTPVARLIPHTAIARVLQSSAAVFDAIERIRDEMFIFNHTPVMLDGELLGVVSSFREAAHVMKSENRVRRTLAKGFVARYVVGDLIHRNSEMSRVVELSREFAKTDSCILITGETGTGKEIVAQSIHNLSRRSPRPFVSVHCSALTEQLLENELFGHEEGAFTGSKKGGKPGLFELAHQGTIFLDEIDSTTFSVQLRLLRVLQEKEVMRVGGDHKIPIDVRVIAAAGKDLWQAVQEGIFRKDLFFRLNVLRITIPPLRQRKEDIEGLLQHFLAHYSKKYGIAACPLPPAYLRRLCDYAWPGNVRQLKHFTEQVVLNQSFECGADALESLYRQLLLIAEGPQSAPQADADRRFPPTPARRSDVSAERVAEALQRARFNKTRAAALLGVGRTTLWRKMKEFNLE
jgi:propionate catabolism operon transcriptional regulator